MPTQNQANTATTTKKTAPEKKLYTLHMQDGKTIQIVATKRTIKKREILFHRGADLVGMVNKRDLSAVEIHIQQQRRSFSAEPIVLIKLASAEIW